MSAFVGLHGFPVSVTLDNTTGAGNADANTLRVVVASDQATIPVSLASAPLATGAATAAKQDTGNTSLASIDGKLPASLGSKLAAASLSVVLASDATLPLPTGAATAAKQDTGNTSIASIDTKTPALGQTTMAGSRPVVIASNQSAIPITDNSGSITVDGTVAISNLPTTVDTNSGAAGASTLRTVLATRHEAVATPLATQLSNGSSAVDYGSGAAGTATLRVALATRHEAVATPLAAQLSNGSAALDYGSGTAGSATLRTVLATRHESASTPISVRISNGASFGSPATAGRAYSDSARNAYSSANVTTSAWTQLIPSTAADINSLYIADTSGQTLELGVGAAASETRKFLIPPGFADWVPLAITAGTRVSIRAVSATADSGEICITGLS